VSSRKIRFSRQGILLSLENQFAFRVERRPRVHVGDQTPRLGQLGRSPRRRCRRSIRPVLGRFVLIEQKLHGGALVGARANQRLMLVVRLVLIELQLHVCQIELSLQRVFHRATRFRNLLRELRDTLLIRRHARLRRVESSRDRLRFRSQRRRIRFGIRQRIRKRQIHGMIGQPQRLLRVAFFRIRHRERLQLLRCFQRARIHQLRCTIRSRAKRSQLLVIVGPASRVNHSRQRQEQHRD
jgi:hypothetical protein